MNLKTLEENAWLGDHYSVCIDKNSDDLFYFETGQEPGGELEGWDAYSIYTSNGLFYPMICNTSLDFDYDRLGTDIINAVHESLTLFGCTHSSSDKSNVWISQNLWRDFTAAYLGVDLLDLMQRYWSFQVFENTQGRGNCFFETVGWNTLCNYPRGLAAFGVFFALGALGVDKVEKIISLKPIRVPSKFPLLQFADWKNKRIPWVNTFIDRGVIQVDVFEDDLLDGFNIKVYENVHNKISKI